MPIYLTDNINEYLIICNIENYCCCITKLIEGTSYFCLSDVYLPFTIVSTGKTTGSYSQ